MEETLIQTFKRYYADYRASANVEQAFKDALEALAYHVIEQCSALAQAGKLEEIRSLLRQFTEIRNSTGGSNDSVKERFEQELVQGLLDHSLT